MEPEQLEEYLKDYPELKVIEVPVGFGKVEILDVRKPPGSRKVGTICNGIDEHGGFISYVAGRKSMGYFLDEKSALKAWLRNVWRLSREIDWGRGIMNTGWEVTPEDIEVVLTAHKSKTRGPDEVFECLTDHDFRRIEKAALRYVEMCVQADSALDEIEDILIERNVIDVKKHFCSPH